MTVGSKKCTSCTAGLNWDLTKLACINCGNGKKETNETCDDAAHGGCLPDCSGSNVGYSCSGGSSTTPSVCVCLPGYSGSPCITHCGDGLVAGTEVCDDGGLGGCLPDCSGITTNFSCTPGSPTSASICNCMTGYSKQPS